MSGEHIDHMMLWRHSYGILSRFWRHFEKRDSIQDWTGMRDF